MTRQVIFSFVVLLVAVSASAQTVPATATISTGGSRPQVTVTNGYKAPLTAYVLRASFGKRSVGQIFDARINFARDFPIPPGQSRLLPLVTQRPAGSAEPVLPTSVGITAALFADGTAAGDQHDVARLKDDRQGLLSQLQTIRAELKQLNGHNRDIPTVLASLDARRQNFLNTTDKSQRSGGEFAYRLATSGFGQIQAYKPNASADEAIAGVLKAVEDHISALEADPH